jgi:hypothetical protein
MSNLDPQTSVLIHSVFTKERPLFEVFLRYGIIAEVRTLYMANPNFRAI